MWDLIGKGEELSQAWMEKEFTPTALKFLRWVQIYGSDEAVWSAHRLMLGIYHDPPPNVLIRLLLCGPKPSLRGGPIFRGQVKRMCGAKD